jgi:hypothetical protein
MEAKRLGVVEHSAVLHFNAFLFTQLSNTQTAALVSAEAYTCINGTNAQFKLIQLEDGASASLQAPSRTSSPAACRQPCRAWSSFRSHAARSAGGFSAATWCVVRVVVSWLAGDPWGRAGATECEKLSSSSGRSSLKPRGFSHTSVDKLAHTLLQCFGMRPMICSHCWEWRLGTRRLLW